MIDVVPFDEWTIRGRWGTPSRFAGPAQAQVFHHPVLDPTGLGSFAQVRAVEEAIWGRRADAGFSMIAYSFVVARNGQAFAGRGYQWRNGANRNTKGGLLNNSNTISICLCGNFEHGQPIPTQIPTDAQLLTAAQIVADGRNRGLIAAHSPTVPHNALHATACPGDELEVRLGRIDQHLTEGATMALHADAEKARILGIWDGQRPDQPASREVASIMAWRAHDKAVAASDAALTDAASRLAEQIAAQDNPPADGPRRQISVRPGESVTVVGRV